MTKDEQIERLKKLLMKESWISGELMIELTKRGMSDYEAFQLVGDIAADYDLKVGDTKAS